MTRSCFPDESLADVAGWAPDDPRRAHLDECPGCRARLAEYLSFLEAGDVVGADPEDAEVRLSAVLAGLGSAPAAGGPRSATPRRRARWLRPAVAAAATVAVAVGLWQALPATRAVSTSPPVLRGESAAPPGPVLLPVRALADGRLALAWRRQPQAETYRVALHDADLRQVALVEAGADSAIAVTPGAARFWRVLAQGRGGEIGRTELAPLRAVE